MRTVKTMVLIGGGSALLAMPALGQGRPLPPQPPPSRAQQGTAGPATPPAPPLSATVTPRAGYAYDGTPVLYTEIPVTVAPDGKVYANFGFGYQLVPQQCSAERLTQPQASAVPTQGPPAYTQPQVTQPVPQATTSSQVMIAQSHANTATRSTGTRQATGACWSRAYDGRVVVHR